MPTPRPASTPHLRAVTATPIPKPFLQVRVLGRAVRAGATETLAVQTAPGTGISAQLIDGRRLAHDARLSVQHDARGRWRILVATQQRAHAARIRVLAVASLPDRRLHVVASFDVVTM